MRNVGKIGKWNPMDHKVQFVGRVKEEIILAACTKTSVALWHHRRNTLSLQLLRWEDSGRWVSPNPGSMLLMFSSQLARDARGPWMTASWPAWQTIVAGIIIIKKIYQLHEAQPNLTHYNSFFPFLKGPLVPFPTERPSVSDSYSEQYWLSR